MNFQEEYSFLSPNKDFYGEGLYIGDIVSYTIIPEGYGYLDPVIKLGIIEDFCFDENIVRHAVITHEIDMLKEYKNSRLYDYMNDEPRKIYTRQLVKIDKKFLINHITLNGLPYDLFEPLLNYKEEG